MKHTLWVFVTLIFTLACNFTAPTLASRPPEPVPVTQTSPALDVSSAAPAAPTVLPTTSATLLYISATMHIESKPDSWPKDVDAFLTFIEQITAAGIRLSIGADVGWLEGGAHVAEIIQRSNAMGVQWDVHAHAATDRAKAAYLPRIRGAHEAESNRPLWDD